MKIYQVGGCVRDELLGALARDVDWLVVGSSPTEMASLGYRQVGADFPVFLHPDSNEEYALARVERKTGFGHKGFETRFDSSVTVEDDLSRRDLTINAMAKDMDSGDIVDPFGGRNDLRDRILRHVSDAFGEDPLRVLRLARFQAKTGFSIHPDTALVCSNLCARGALLELSVERVCSELRKLMECPRPAAAMASLASLGALASLDAAWPGRLGPAQLDALDAAASASLPEWCLVRLACCPGMDAKASALFLERLRFPSDIARGAARMGGFCLWARENLGVSPQDFDAACEALEQAGLTRLGTSDRLVFKRCARLEMLSWGATPSMAALADAMVDASAAIASADLSEALAQEGRRVPAAVKAAKAEALRRAWTDPPAPSRGPRS